MSVNQFDLIFHVVTEIITSDWMNEIGGRDNNYLTPTV